MAEIRMTWNVRAVLKLYDSFTLKPASLSMFRVTADAGLTAIKKPEGILVFVENHNFHEMAAAGILLESPVYTEKKLSVPMTGEPQVMVVWMDPGERYPAPATASRLYGKTLPGKELTFVFTEGTGSLRLLGDYKPGVKTLEIYHPGMRSLEGYTLEFECSGKREFVKIGMSLEDQRPETGTYLALSAPKLGPYPKMETILRIVSHAKADAEGRYTFFFRNVPSNPAAGRIGMETEEGKKEEEVHVRAGNSVRFDLAVKEEE